MANPYLILWFDPTLNRLYTGWNQNTPAAQPILKQGDNVGVELHWVRGGNANYPMQEITFPPAANLTLAVGRLDAEPTSGIYTLSYGGDTTALDIAFDATAAELETALNDLASITAEGGVIVNKTGSVFRIVWNNPSVTANTLTADVNNLSPTTNSQVVVAREGSATDRQILLFSLRQAPIAACTSFTPTTAPALTVTNIFPSTWRVSIEPSPRTGTFTITQHIGAATTQSDPLPSSASAAAVESILDGLTAGYYVVKSGEFSWDITVPPTVTNITATSALVPYSSMYGVLSMNTAEVEEFLAGNDTGIATLEVEADISGEIQTLIQTNVTVINDLISTSIFNLVQLPDVMPVDSVVRYDTAQALTTGEQLQARTNIGAAASTEIAALVAEDVLLSGRITVIEGDYATETGLTAGLATKAALVHTHTASQISNSTLAGRNLLTATDVATQRTELGLGTMALETATDYLTKAGNLSGLTSTSTARTNLGLGTMATASSTDYLAKLNNLSDVASVSTARTNLGLGTMATASSTDYLASANNLADVQDVLTTRSNLGIGEVDTPTFAGISSTAAITTPSVIVTDGVSGIGVTHTEITFPDATTQNTRVVRSYQGNGSGFSTGGFDTVHYPSEVKVIADDGSEWWVPARPA